MPGWMWLLFGLGLIPVGILFCLATASSGQSSGLAVVGAGLGLILGLPMLGGLALSSRLFHDSGSRIVMGIIFSFIILVGLAGIVFAGCLCVMNGSNIYH